MPNFGNLQKVVYIIYLGLNSSTIPSGKRSAVTFIGKVTQNQITILSKSLFYHTWGAYEYMENLHTQIPDILQKFAEGPHTLCHADLWTTNMMFDESNVVFIDWQWMCLGNGLMDVAFLLYNSVDVHLVEKLEGKWLKKYHKILCINGVSDYSFEKCQEDFKAALIWSFIFNFRTLGNLCPLERVVHNLKAIIPPSENSLTTTLFVVIIAIGIATLFSSIILVKKTLK